MDEPASKMDGVLGFSQRQHRAILAVIVVQFVLITANFLTLDDGYRSRIGIHAALGYWLMTGTIACMRSHAPTKLDVLLFATGFFWWVPVAMAVEAIVRALFFHGI